MMDRFIDKAHGFAANLRNFARKSGKVSKCTLVFTRSDMQCFGEKKRVTFIYIK